MTIQGYLPALAGSILTTTPAVGNSPDDRFDPDPNHRQVLAGATAVAALTVPALTILPKQANGETGEQPWIKAKRLAAELSATLAECDGGATMALIEPPDAAMPVAWAQREHYHASAALQPGEAAFTYYARRAGEDLKARGETWEVRVTAERVLVDLTPATATRPAAGFSMADFALARFGRLAATHREAEAAYLQAQDNATSVVADEALGAICAYVPFGQADARAKADYLTEYLGDGDTNELSHGQVIALLAAAGRYEMRFSGREVA